MLQRTHNLANFTHQRYTAPNSSALRQDSRRF